AGQRTRTRGEQRAAQSRPPAPPQGSLRSPWALLRRPSRAEDRHTTSATRNHSRTQRRTNALKEAPRWANIMSNPRPLSPRPAMRRTLLALVALLLSPLAARAEVKSLEIYRRAAFADGAAFGDTGPYEKLV